jgi:hypothetical protein
VRIAAVDVVRARVDLELVDPPAGPRARANSAAPGSAPRSLRGGGRQTGRATRVEQADRRLLVAVASARPADRGRPPRHGSPLQRDEAAGSVGTFRRVKIGPRPAPAQPPCSADPGPFPAREGGTPVASPQASNAMCRGQRSAAISAFGSGALTPQYDYSAGSSPRAVATSRPPCPMFAVDAFLAPGQYALCSVFDLAYNGQGEPVQVRVVSERRRSRRTSSRSSGACARRSWW